MKDVFRRVYRLIARHRFLSSIVLVCGALLMASCGSIGYYAQAAGGHLKLMRARQPIQDLLANDSTSPELREKLQTLVDARVIGIKQLLLPDNDSYKTYVETGRRAVTWNVVAAKEFSVQAKTWCFPVAGCVSYKGYFDRADAQAFADTLVEQSYDVSVGGASAYSTLGWFDDPVLDTMLRGGDIRYVGTLFHELAHQVLYVKGDSNFNEAFASFIEQLGTRQWLLQRDESDRIANYEASLGRAEDFVALLKKTRESLQTLYAEDLTDELMRERKRMAFETMRGEYEALKVSWNGYAGYDNWFKRDLNNARLVAVSTYRRFVPAFFAMYVEANYDLMVFYKIAEEIAELPAQDRRIRMEGYLQSS